MARRSCPEHGTVVVYLNPNALARAAFLRGVVIGPPVVDPETHHEWVPVLRPDRTVFVLDTAIIARVLPPFREPAARPPRQRGVWVNTSWAESGRSTSE